MVLQRRYHKCSMRRIGCGLGIIAYWSLNKGALRIEVSGYLYFKPIEHERVVRRLHAVWN